MIRTLTIIVVMLTSLTTVQASSVDSCSNISLREDFGPVRNQGNSDWCGSFVAADLFSFYAKKRVSATSVGIAYYTQRSSLEARTLNAAFSVQEGEYGAAFLSSILRIASKSQLCPEEELSDNLIAYDTRNIFLQIDNIKGMHSQKLLCPNPIKTNFNRRVVGRDYIPRKRLSYLHSSLEKHEPVAAIIDDSWLSTNHAGSSTDKIFGNHFVTVVGREKIDGQCNFIIRNSWGNSCDIYSSNIEKCDDEGYLWISEYNFKKMLKNTVYLTNPKKN